MSALDKVESSANRIDEPLTISKMTAAPKILLTATLRWPIAARLAIAFSKIGCRVDVICPREHPGAKTDAIRKRYHYSALQPLISLYVAIKYSEPDLIIPCDDNAADHLHRLYVQACNPDQDETGLRDLIARSLGSPEACALAIARGRLMALAEGEGILVPETTVVAKQQEVDCWLRDHKFPAVMKMDCTWGGQGVSIIRNNNEALNAFRTMSSRPAIAHAFARMLLDRDPAVFLNALKMERRTITLQDFIPGIPANRAVACWQGKVLAGISVKAIKTQHPTGPATVVRIIENPEMSESVNRLVCKLGIYGLLGVDFILDASTGAAYLIEMNPRATPICHLSLGAGRDLPAALYFQMAGLQPLVMPEKIDRDVIAMFPGEWRRNPASRYLRSDYHDVPWDEPTLIQECVNRPWAERGLVARLWKRVCPASHMLSIPQKQSIGAEISAKCPSTDVGHDLVDYLPSEVGRE